MADEGEGGGEGEGDCDGEDEAEAEAEGEPEGEAEGEAGEKADHFDTNGSIAESPSASRARTARSKLSSPRKSLFPGKPSRERTSSMDRIHRQEQVEESRVE